MQVLMITLLECSARYELTWLPVVWVRVLSLCMYLSNVSLLLLRLTGVRSACRSISAQSTATASVHTHTESALRWSIVYVEQGRTYSIWMCKHQQTTPTGYEICILGFFTFCVWAVFVNPYAAVGLSATELPSLLAEWVVSWELCRYAYAYGLVQFCLAPYGKLMEFSCVTRECGSPSSGSESCPLHVHRVCDIPYTHVHMRIYRLCVGG